MPVFKNDDNGTWYVMARYVNWKGERKQKCKRGFATKKEAQEWERMFQLQNSSDLDMSFGTSISYEKDGRQTERFDTPDAENVIELNGIKSELVICND